MHRADVCTHTQRHTALSGPHSIDSVPIHGKWCPEVESISQGPARQGWQACTLSCLQPVKSAEFSWQLQCPRPVLAAGDHLSQPPAWVAVTGRTECALGRASAWAAPGTHVLLLGDPGTEMEKLLAGLESQPQQKEERGHRRKLASASGRLHFPRRQEEASGQLVKRGYGA